MRKEKQELIPVIINCDTGIDDAVAIMIAVKSNKLDIKLITTDIGNVDTKKAAENTLNILELLDAPDIPVVAGDGKCYKKERERFQAHGGGGLGEYLFEEHKRKVVEGDAVDKMAEVLENSDKKITIISIAPPVNLAKLLKKHKSVMGKIEKVVLMAGSIEEVGENEMPYPEFNISSNPEAAEVLLKSGVKVEIVPMEMGHTAYLDWQEVFKTKLQNYTGSVFEMIFRSYRDRHVKNGVATHDGCAVAYLTNPEIFETKPVYAEIKYFKTIDSGVIIMDFNKEPNFVTCTKVDVKKFKKLYFSLLQKCR